MNEGAPDWRLLQTDPQRFLGLPEPFDRTQLKRAYNSWIKRYKPDQSPEEFQKIREAYERLETQLRTATGDQAERNQAPCSRNESSPHGVNVDVSSFATSNPFQDALPSDSTELENPPDSGKSAEELFGRLKAKKSKSPRDYYKLAVLSDVLHPPSDSDSRSFTNWLAEGVMSYPKDFWLKELFLAHAAKCELDQQQLKTLLQDLAARSTSDVYFSMSAPLWKRYILLSEWSEFEKTLRECDSKLRIENTISRTAFLVQLLRSSLFKAPKYWLEKTVQQLESSHGEMNSMTAYEFEVLTAISALRMELEPFRAKGRICSQMIDVLRGYCEWNEEQWIGKMVQCQCLIADHPDELFHEIKLTPAENSEILISWVLISQEAGALFDPYIDERHPPVAYKQATTELLKELDARFPNHLWRNNQELASLHRLVVAVGSAIIALLVGMVPLVCLSLGTAVNHSLRNNPWVLFLDFAPILVSLGFWVWWFRRKVGRINSIYANRFNQIMENHYLSKWRYPLARMLAATDLTYQDLSHIITSQVEENRKTLGVSTWLPQFLRRDVGLWVYAMSVRYQR